MPKKVDKAHAAIHEILTAIAKGTKKMDGDEFFWGLHAQLKAYDPKKHATLASWLRKAGVRNVPSPAQCAAARKMARSRQNLILAAYTPGDRGY